MAKILVVEDEPDLREAIVEELNDEGHITVEAGNGREGLEKLGVETPDMILSDITMPEMNGYQFFRSVKERHPEHAHTPFMFLTALSDRDDELKGLRLGVDDYMTKPIDFDLLIARVDLALRRRQPPPAAAESPAQQGPDEDGDKLASIIKENDGQVLTGKFETISLEKLRAKVGDRWSEVSDAILRHAEAVIREHLSAKDALHVTSSQDFVVCFASSSQDQVDSQVDEIRDAIWDRLFNHTKDEDLSQVDAQAFALRLTGDGSSNGVQLFAEIDDLVVKEKEAASDDNQQLIRKLYDYEDLYALALLTSKGTPSKIKMVTFSKKTVDRMRQLFAGCQFSTHVLLELHETLFARLKEKKTLEKAFEQTAMLLPIHFDLMDDPEKRARLRELCKDLEQSMKVRLIVEIIEAPDRVQPHKAALAPLLVERQLQFLELRRAAQLNNVRLGELREMGISVISMKYSHALRHDESTLHELNQNLERAKMKLFIKDIPEGKMFEMLNYNAHLYAMAQ